jgi:hypothetical protein
MFSDTARGKAFFITVFMGKRFGDTEIWKRQRWFRKLKPEYKLAFFYIKDQCDHAGIWNIDCSDLIEDVGIESFNITDFVTSLNTEYDKITGQSVTKDRVIILNSNMLWITGFLQFQYEGKDKVISYSANAVKSALYILDSIKFNPSEPFRTLPNPSEPLSVLEYAIVKLHIRANQPLAVFVQGLRTLKDKDKDKDKVVKQKKNENEKFSGNFKAQGEEFFLNRVEEGIKQLNEGGTDGN